MLEVKVNASIPKDRIGVLVGPKGTVKSRVEDSMGVDLAIDSETGLVDIRLRRETQDPSNALRAKDIVVAIGRGFSPERALTLVNEDNTLDVLDLHDIFGKNEAEIRRVDGRIIGREGKTRKIIEEMTGTLVSVSRHTISIIGTSETGSPTKDSIEKLLKSRQHRTAYKFLRRKKNEPKKEKALGLWEGQKAQAKKP